MDRVTRDWILEPLRRAHDHADHAARDAQHRPAGRGVGLGSLAQPLGEMFRRMEATTGLRPNEVIERSFRRFAQRMPRRAHMALRRGMRASKSDRRYLEDFFNLCLGRAPTPEGRYAFHLIMSRSRRWREIRNDGVVPYIRESVWREARRVRMRWNQEGILAGRRKRREVRAATHMYRSCSTLQPDEELIRKEAVGLRRCVLARLRERGSDRDRKALRMLEEGMTPAEMVASGEITWADWQGFQRKARRWLEGQPVA